MNRRPHRRSRGAILIVASIALAACGGGDDDATPTTTEPPVRVPGQQRSFTYEAVDASGRSYLLDVRSLPTFSFRKEPVDDSPGRARLVIDILGAPSGSITPSDVEDPEVRAVFRYHFPLEIARGSSPGFDDPACHLDPNGASYSPIPRSLVCDVEQQPLGVSADDVPVRLTNTEIVADEATIDRFLRELGGVQPFVRVSVTDRFGVNLDGRCFVVVGPLDTLVSVQANRCAVGAPGEVDRPVVPPPPTEPECPPTEGTAERTVAFTSPPPWCLEEGTDFFADIETNFGSITVRLDTERADVTVNNFVFLARHRYFDDTVCHRAIPGFMFQCGDPLGTGQGGPGYQIPDQLPATGEYQVGSLAMANAGPDTSGSQFFIVTGPQGEALPPAYSLFGQVEEGLDVVAAIDAVGNPADNGIPPLQPIEITSVSIRTTPQVP